LLTFCDAHERLLSSKREKRRLLYAHMDAERYQPETLSTIRPAQEAQSGIENGEPQIAEKGQFYCRFGELIADISDDLEKALARFQEEQKNSKRMDVTDAMSLSLAIYRISQELFMRKSPEARELRDTLRENGLRKIAAQKKWEKEIIATEGEEGLKRRKQNGEGPINQNTPKELDMKVRNVQLQVDAGILKPSDLEHAIAVRDAGGFYQWEKERKRKGSEAHIQKLAAINHPTTGKVLENIRRLNEEEYGTDYAQRQHAILAELASIASQKAASTQSVPSDSTTG